MFRQVKEILLELQYSLDSVIDYFNNVKNDGKEDYRNYFIQNLVTKKTELNKIIKHYEVNSNASVLNKWIQFSPETEFDKELQKYKTQHEIPLSKAMELAIVYDNWLQDIITHLVDKTSSQQSQGVFSGLLQKIEKEKLSNATDQSLMQDL
jgi:hypothetical protein